jgi:hypothetical protein
MRNGVSPAVPASLPPHLMPGMAVPGLPFNTMQSPVQVGSGAVSRLRPPHFVDPLSPNKGMAGNSGGAGAGSPRSAPSTSGGAKASAAPSARGGKAAPPGAGGKSGAASKPPTGNAANAPPNAGAAALPRRATAGKK